MSLQAQIDLKTLSQYEDDTDLLARVVEMWALQSDTDLAEIQAAALREDLESVRRLAHRCKGAAATLGAAGCAASFLKLEELAHSRVICDLTRAIESCAVEVDAAVAALRELLAG